MLYNKKQLLQIISNKDLPESSLSQIYNVRHYSHSDNYDLLLGFLESQYFFISKYLLSQLKDFIAQNPQKFTKLRELIPHDGEFDKMMKEIEVNLSFEVKDQKVPDFSEFINSNKLNLKFSHQIAQKSGFAEITKRLEFISRFDVGDISLVEEYLQRYLEIHKNDIDVERKKILDYVGKEGFDTSKNDIYSYEKPKMLFTESMDGTMDVANKKDFFIYKFKEELIEKDKIFESPYFLFITNEKNDYFIGKRYYKDAIISYTSNFARSIRYSDDTDYDYIDLIIKDSDYQRIFVRNSENKSQINVDGDENEFLEEKVEKSSGIADISNLLTDYQDLIFRSPLKGLVLVEGVAGSGKTNLIFHRIDYLLQEYPQNFKKENIGIIVKNIYLKEYMLSALSSTDFGFRDDVNVNIFKDLILNIVANYSNFDKTKLVFDTEKDMSLDFQKIKDNVHKYFIDLLQNNIENLKRKLNLEFENYLDDLQENAAMNAIVIKGLENVGNSYLKDAKQKINQFEIDGTKSFYQNLNALENIVQSILKRLETKRVLSDRKMSLLEDEVLARFPMFRDDLFQNILKDNRLYLDDVLSKMTDNYYLSVVFLVHSCFEQVQGRSILPIYDYVLVDEFQDFTYQELYFLYHFYPAMVWSGDLTQSTIYHSTDILQSFEIVDKKLIQDNFRNTLEIVKFANEVLKNCKIYNLNVKRVNRRGNKPFIIGDDLKQIGEIISQSIQNAEKLGIAYLDKKIVEKIIKDNKLDDKDFYYDIQKDKKFDNNYKIYFFDYANIKGLEFDNVILLNVDNLVKTMEDKNLKLFYIGITRAVRKLYIQTSLDTLKMLNIEDKYFEMI